MRILNSAHGLQFPILSVSVTVPSTARVKEEPTAPPMMLRPLIWPASEGYLANTCAILVTAPVATNQAVPGGVLKSADAIASIAGSDLGGTVGTGKSEVPSSPDSPWISPAWAAGRTRPEEAPGYTGIEDWPMAVSTDPAL